MRLFARIGGALAAVLERRREARRTSWPEGQEPELAALNRELTADEYLARYRLSKRT